LGGRNFCPPAKFFLKGIEKCFALHRHQAGGAAGRVSSVQSRFALRSVIATKKTEDYPLFLAF